MELKKIEESYTRESERGRAKTSKVAPSLSQLHKPELMLSEGRVTYLSIRSATELQRFEYNPSTDEEPVAISQGFRQAGDVKTESENRITSRDSRTPIVESVKHYKTAALRMSGAANGRQEGGMLCSSPKTYEGPVADKWYVKRSARPSEKG